MTPDRVGKAVRGGDEPDEERTERERRDALRDALAAWPTGVSILAARADDRVHALTVGSFIPVSLQPPLVLASLGPNAAALPYLDPGTRFAISVLADHQKGLAARYADTFPVGPSPFPESGDPIVAGALAVFVCEVDELIERGDHTLVVGRVVGSSAREDGSALAYFRRTYHSVSRESRIG